MVKISILYPNMLHTEIPFFSWISRKKKEDKKKKERTRDRWFEAIESEKVRLAICMVVNGDRWTPPTSDRGKKERGRKFMWREKKGGGGGGG